MRFRNPWIDPRIVHVRPEDAKAYLVRRGWKAVGPAANPLLEMFEGPGNGDDAPTVLVPLQLDQGPLLQRMIDLVGELAQVENRWAVAILDDILLHTPAEPPAANGPQAPARAEPVTR